MEEKEARLIITWDRESGQAHFDLVGMSHVEAMRLLLGIMTANFEHALGEVQPSPPTPLPEGEGGKETHDN